MKTFLALIIFSIAGFASAENCSFAVKDRYGYEYETVSRIGYSSSSACSDAEYACKVILNNAQARGKYLDANCALVRSPGFPNRPPDAPTAIARCTTDMVNYYNSVVRSFTANGRTQEDACMESARQCKIEMARQENYGHRCVRRGTGGGGNIPPRPRETTESCQARRFDPAGRFIEAYRASHTGPIGTNVKEQACRKAYNSCSYDLKGTQYCTVER